MTTSPTSAVGSEPRVILIGAAHMDRIARSDSPYRPHTSNPGHLSERVGGAAFNAATALHKFGMTSFLVSVRGGDAGGASVEAALADRGIGDGSLTWLDRATPTYTAILDDRGELVAGIADMALYDLVTPRLVSRRHLRLQLDACAALLVDANLPAETLCYLASERRSPVAAIGVSPGKVGRLAEALPHLAMLFVSRLEAATLGHCAPDAEPRLLAEALVSVGVRRAVITDGPRQACIIDDGQVFTQAPPPVEIIRDVTGAGDTLAAVTLSEWLEGAPFCQAARTGMAAASLHIAAGLSPGCAETCRNLGATLAPLRPIA